MTKSRGDHLMATVTRPTRDIPLSEYPTGDGKPMAETPVHRKIMTMLIECLEDRYTQEPMVYVSGNMMMYYVQNDKRRHVSPDVFFVRGIANAERDAYFVWLEGKGPNVVFEISSETTSKIDTGTKLLLYQNVLRVPEYFLFDPLRRVSVAVAPGLPAHQWHLCPDRAGVRVVVQPRAGSEDGTPRPDAPPL